MKTTKNTLLKVIRYFPILFLSFIVVSCTVDVPDSDTVPPKFSFKITGDGFDQTFNQDTDFSSFQLNLKQGATYNFILSGGDGGGVKQIQWQYAHDYVEFTDPITSPWVQSTVSPLSSVINWFGERSNPVSGSILAGKIVIEGNQVSHEFIFMVKDFGGESGNTNTIYASLNIYGSNHTTEIISF